MQQYFVTTSKQLPHRLVHPSVQRVLAPKAYISLHGEASS